MLELSPAGRSIPLPSPCRCLSVQCRVHWRSGLGLLREIELVAFDRDGGLGCWWRGLKMAESLGEGKQGWESRMILMGTRRVTSRAGVCKDHNVHLALRSARKKQPHLCACLAGQSLSWVILATACQDCRSGERSANRTSTVSAEDVSLPLVSLRQDYQGVCVRQGHRSLDHRGKLLDVIEPLRWMRLAGLQARRLLLEG